MGWGTDEKVPPAVIIDIQGEKQKVFQLDGKGGDVYRQMIEYLDNLSAMNYDDPAPGPMPSYSEEEVNAVIEKSFSEFESALQTAMSLFNDDEKTLKHLLVLTAGPVWINKLAENQAYGFNSAIMVSSLSSSPGGCMTTLRRRPYFLANSKSLWSWVGTAITAPVP